MTEYRITDDGKCTVCGFCGEDRKLHVYQLHSELTRLRAEVERLKEENETVACTYCGQRFVREATETITKHIEDCEKHPANYWMKQAELYKSEFLGRDVVWKKAESRLALLERVAAAARNVKAANEQRPYPEMSLELESALEHMAAALSTLTPPEEKEK